MKSNSTKRLFLDSTIILFSYFLAALFSHKKFDEEQLLIPILLLFIWNFTSKYFELYDEFRTSTFVNELLIIIPNVFFQFIATGFIYFILNDQTFSRLFTLYYVIILLGMIISKKYLFKQWKIYNWSKGNDIKNLLVIGCGINGKAYFELAKKNKQYGYNPLGFVDLSKPTNFKEHFLGNLEELDSIIKGKKINEVIICLADQDTELVKHILSICDRYAVRSKIVPENVQYYSNKFKMDIFGHLPVIVVRDEPLEEFHWIFLKNSVDIVVSIVISVLILSWLAPIIAILIKLDSAGPILYVQERWGKDGKVFRCFKFRTMVHQSSTKTEKGHFLQTTQNDSRITKIGKILRRTNLDEIPQFLNVFLGEMSLVGPRPHAVQHSIESFNKVNKYLVRHLVKPGITGWAQVNGYRGETKELFLMEKRVEYDIWYIENWSVWLDIKVFVMTIYITLKGDKLAY